MEIHSGQPDVDMLITLRIPHQPGRLAKLLTLIGENGGLIGDIKTLFVGKTHTLRQITVSVYDIAHLEEVKSRISNVGAGEIVQIDDPVFQSHQGGKIGSKRRIDIDSFASLRYVYTPGVARVCEEIQRNPASARNYTSIGMSVGILTNGTRVLGLGDIGVVPSMPVMEGKAMLYDQFVGLSATPILIDTKDPEEFINIAEKIAPTFGGIHLEDIRVPDCFHIEEELRRRLKKPVMHDDQHGTATVVLAAVMSSCRMSGAGEINKDLVVAQIGLGAAGFGIGSLLIEAGARVIGVDPSAEARKHFENYGGETATLEEAVSRAKVVIATTGRVGLLTSSMIREGQIILPLSNPVPEIQPEEALAAGASFAADGKSINNALAFPGLFKAALEEDAHEISPKMKIAAAKIISDLADDGELVPSIFHPNLHRDVVRAVRKAITG